MVVDRRNKVRKKSVGIKTIKPGTKPRMKNCEIVGKSEGEHILMVCFAI